MEFIEKHNRLSEQRLKACLPDNLPRCFRATAQDERRRETHRAIPDDDADRPEHYRIDVELPDTERKLQELRRDCERERECEECSAADSAKHLIHRDERAEREHQ